MKYLPSKKFIFFVTLLVLVNLLLISIVLGWFLDPPLSKSTFSEFYYLENWNSPMHAMSDFDGDGVRDIVTFNGCAIFSSLSAEEITEADRCMAPGITELVFPEEGRKIGQKLLKTKAFDFGANGDWPFSDNYIKHAYIGLVPNQGWQIVVKTQQEGVRLLIVDNNGMLQTADRIPIRVWIDEILYDLGSYWMVLLVPVVIALIIKKGFLEIPSTEEKVVVFLAVVLAVVLLGLVLWDWRRRDQQDADQNGEDES